MAVHDKAQNNIVPPCGNCRQMLLDYSPEIKVILNDENSEPVKVDIRDVLPLSWIPVDCE